MDSIRLFIRRLEGGGIFLLALAYCVTLATYSPHDPSPDTWTSSPVIQNFFGRFGSALADVLWQSFGAATYLGALVLTAWAWVTCSDRKLDLIVGRALAAFLAFWAFGTFVALIAPFFPFFPSLAQGNAIGVVTKTGLEHLLPGLVGSAIISLVVLGVGLSALHMAMGLVHEEWKAIWTFCAETAQTSTHAVIEFFVRLSEKLRARFMPDFDQEILPRSRRLDPDDEDEEDAEGEEDAEDSGEKEGFFSKLFSRHKRKLLDEFEEEQDEDDTEEEEEEGEEDSDDSDEESSPSKAKIVHRSQPTAKQARLALHKSSPKAFPPLDLLQWPDAAKQQRPELSEDALEKNAKLLESVLADFGVYGQITKVSPGPVVTLYELEPSPGTRASRVISLADDIARNMSATAVRVAVVPGRNVIGIELPNKKREIVYLRELLSTDTYNDHAGALPIVLGKDIAGMPVIADLARMPHLLIAGTTGSGKSVAINTMILSLLYRLSPERCRFIMIDPKMLELSVYEGIPHLLAPVVTEPKKAIVALKWTVREMEERYRAMSKLGVRNIEGYNIRLTEAAKNNENLTRKVQTGYDKDTGKPIFEEQPLDLTPLPYIVVIVDEMADLMIVSGKEIESAVQRLAQMARAAGIHILMATQRPSVDVITGTIKANFPTRISFQVTSKIDSRTILGEQGAEQLLGQGDMLYMAGGGRVTRVHGPFVRDDEVESIVAFLKKQGEPDYLDAVTEEADEGGGDYAGGESSGSGEDSLYDKAVDIVLRERKASTSFVQRHLSIGYNKAATLIERMENENIISPANHVGKREVYGRKPDDDE